jgi:hypothetical protein
LSLVIPILDKVKGIRVAFPPAGQARQDIGLPAFLSKGLRYRLWTELASRNEDACWREMDRILRLGELVDYRWHPSGHVDVHSEGSIALEQALRQLPRTENRLSKLQSAIHCAEPIRLIRHLADRRLVEVLDLLETTLGDPNMPTRSKYSPFGRAYVDRLISDAKFSETALRRSLLEVVGGLQVLLKRRMEWSVRDRLVDLGFMGPQQGAIYTYTPPQFVESIAYAETRLRCLEAAIAVERFRLGTGRLPQRLDELVPLYLEAVPVDPFSQIPVILRVEKGVCWIDGVGTDRVHEPGKASADDIRVSVDPEARD